MTNSMKYATTHHLLKDDKTAKAVVEFLAGKDITATWDSAKQTLFHNKRMTKLVVAELLGFMQGLMVANYWAD